MEKLYEALWPVHVIPVYGVAQLKLKERLSIMDREAEHLKVAIKGMQAGLAGNDAQVLYHPLRNARNWTLSLVMSQCYVQTMLGAVTLKDLQQPMIGSIPMVEIQASYLFERATKIGVSQGKLDRVL